MASFRVYYSLTTLIHISNTSSYIRYDRRHPLIFYTLPQLCKGTRGPFGHSLFQQPPHILYRVQVKRISIPAHLVYTTHVMELLGKLGSVRRSTSSISTARLMRFPGWCTTQSMKWYT